MYLQGPRWLSGNSKLGLKYRNMHAKKILNGILRTYSSKHFIKAGCSAKNDQILGFQNHLQESFSMHNCKYLSERIYVVHLAIADPVNNNIQFC